MAAERFEAYREILLNVYDAASDARIVTEAGSKVTKLNNGPDYPQKGILASNGALHDAMLSFF